MNIEILDMGFLGKMLDPNRNVPKMITNDGSDTGSSEKRVNLEEKLEKNGIKDPEMRRIVGNFLLK